MDIDVYYIEEDFSCFRDAEFRHYANWGDFGIGDCKNHTYKIYKNDGGNFIKVANISHPHSFEINEVYSLYDDYDIDKDCLKFKIKDYYIYKRSFIVELLEEIKECL